jgi:FKBP-type peptidyl-prolyl cis-trans isomerase 2
MKRLVLVIVIAFIVLSGCVGQKTVKIGDNVSVDYTGSLTNGKVFDTSIEEIAKENNLSTPGREYKPLQLTVGKGQVIKGFDEGIIGMKVGESKTLTIPPEKGYQKNPQLIQTIPVIQDVPIMRSFPKAFDIPVGGFEEIFGVGNKIGDEVKIPDTNINLTVQSITTSNVSVSYDLNVGDEISQLPWNETVIKVDDKNITAKSNVKKNDIIQLKDAPWTTTVIDINSENMTLKHNSIPDTTIQSSSFAAIRVHFNETHITLDQNNEIAGETLIFNVTIRSIESTTP